MAENPKFNNSNMFTSVNSDYSEVTPNNNSEVLATQGNVINSIKVFWNRLKEKLAFAITRDDTSKAVGTEYRPVYVDINGEVKQCNGLEKTVSSITNNNIDIGNISPIIGTTLSLNVTSNINNPNNLLTINNQKVLYPTGVEVKAKIDANTNLLVVYNGADWILINKMNEAKTSGKTSASGAGGNGYSGLMTADDKAKLETIEWGANNYTLPTASTTEKGGVKLGADKLTSLNTPTSYSTAGRYYPIQTDKDNKLVVNVPWSDTNDHDTARITVGTQGAEQNSQTNGTQATYINILDNDNENKSYIKVKGEGGTAVSSNSSGELVITSSRVTTYLGLKNDDKNNNYEPLTGYLVYGPGQNKANTNNYLAGDGTWVNGILVPIPTEEGKTLKSRNNGTVYWG
jgi:hypothetical protein